MVEDRMCYFVQETVKDGNGNYIACIAVEGERGYHKTDWTWGNDRDIAEDTAKLMNTRLGLTEEDSIQIVLSSMFAK